MTGTPAPAVGEWGGLTPVEAPVINPPSTQAVSAAPPEITDWTRLPRLVGRKAETGLATFAGYPGSFLRFGSQIVNALLPESMRGPSVLEEAGLMPPTSQEVVDYLGRHGVGMQSNIMPSGPFENALGGAVQGAAQTAPMLLFGPEAAVAPGLIGGAAGGAAENLTGSPAVGAAVGALGGFGAQGIINLFSKGVEGVAAKLGTSETMQEAGEALVDAAKKWRNTEFDAMQNRAAAPLDAAVTAAGGVPVNPSEVVTRANDLIARGGQAADATRAFFDRTIKSGGALSATAKDIAVGNTVSWDEARKFRTELGSYLRTSRPTDKAAIEYLYGGATNDLGAAANTIGAGDLFSNFNAVSRFAHEFNDGLIENILSSSEPGAMASRMLTQGRQGGSSLQELRQQMPDAVDELAAAHLRTGGVKAWQRLSPEAREQLVADPSLRAFIDRQIPRPVAAGMFGATGAHTLESLLGGGVAHATAMLAGHLFPETAGLNPLITGAGGELLGYAAPSLWRGIRAAGRQPSLLVAPAVGAFSGGNALQPQAVTP